MKEIIDGMGISRSITRIAHEIVEENKGVEDLILVGLKTRGAYLSDRLAKKINEFEASNVESISLDISFWRDDIDTSKIQKPLINVDFTNKIVVIVDDVLFSGRSVRAAMEAIISNGRPHKIHLAVLVDRGHRQLPIRPDFIGKNVPTSIKEEVVVMLEEIDKREGIFLNR